MKVNLYYRTVYKRTNKIQEAVLDLFLSISSWPRMVLEVFLRRNQGERYFSFSGALFVLVVLALMPIFFEDSFRSLLYFEGFWRRFHPLTIIWGNFFWYAYLAAYLIMAIKRKNEIKRLPSVFDFARFSLSTGETNPRFYRIGYGGNPFNIRTIETLLEPALFFAIGFVLWLIGQSLGVLLIVCSIIYSLSYCGAYYKGDQFIMDQIDELICSEELVSSFVEGRNPNETRGVRYLGRRPADPEARRQIASNFIIEEDIVEAL